jgi:hypothetical protein
MAEDPDFAGLDAPLDVAEDAADAQGGPGQAPGQADDDSQGGQLAQGQDPATGRFVPGNPYRWRPGQTGNPAGHSEARRARSELERAGELLVEDPRTKKLVKLRDLAFESIWRTAVKGGSAGVAAFREIIDRTEGKVPLPFRLSNEGATGETDWKLEIQVVDTPALEQYRIGSAEGQVIEMVKEGQGGKGNGKGNGGG